MASDETSSRPSSDEPQDGAARGDSGARSPIDRPIQVVAVAGAKGGVGKTLVASNLALYLATIGRRVILVDADAAGASAHTLLGAPPPVPLRTYVPPEPELRKGRAAEQVELDLPFESELPEETATTAGPRSTVPPPPSFVDTPIETSIPNLKLVHAGLDQRVLGQGRVASRVGLLDRVRALTADYAVVDLGSGTEESLLDFYSDADLNVFLVTPEPTSLEQTYRFVRELFQRRVRRRLDDRESLRYEELIQRLGNAPPPQDLFLALEEDEPMRAVVAEEMENFRFRLVVNQARVRTDLEIGAHIRSAVLRRFGVRVDYLGYIDYDDTATTCVRTRRPLLIESPGTKASRSLEKIARRLLSSDAKQAGARALRTAPPHTYHDLLEIERGATDEDVRRAFKRAKEIFGPQSMVTYGLFDPEGLEALRAKIDEAYDVLLDPSRRRPYELSVFSTSEAPTPVVEDEARAEDRPPPPVISPDTEFTGELLHAVRISQGLELREISRVTKIGIHYLQCIEADEFSRLPAPVYVRGFVTEVAKVLRLDHEHVARTYLARYRRYLEERGEL